jgi:hypothetical protein
MRSGPKVPDLEEQFTAEVVQYLAINSAAVAWARMIEVTGAA